MLIDVVVPSKVVPNFNKKPLIKPGGILLAQTLACVPRGTAGSGMSERENI
jgi:hypothetical protein